MRKPSTGVTTTVRLRGYLVGNIWMPNCECFKELSYSLDDQSSRWSERGTLRDHVLAATNDGDFQSCNIAHGELVITRTKGRRKVTRSFPLSMFPSVADCLHSDPDWFPDYGGDD